MNFLNSVLFCFNGFELFSINLLSFMYVLMDVLMNFLDWVLFASLTMIRFNAIFGKFYEIAVRPAMLYGTECWAVKKKIYS